MQVTEAARKHSGTASQKVQDAKDYATDTAQAGSDYVKDTHQQGESAWQKVKDRVTETVDKVDDLDSHCSARCHFILTQHIPSCALGSVFLGLCCIPRCTVLHYLPNQAWVA